MENIAIGQFVQIQGIEGAYFLFATSSGEGGKATPTVVANALTRTIRPSIDPTTKRWFIGTVDTGLQAEGRTPEIRKSGGSIEWKYTTENDMSWRPILSVKEVMFTFDDLNAEQKDQLTLHFRDLTEDDIKALQQPAADMIAKVDAHDKAYTEAEKARVEAENGRVAAENARVAEEKKRVSAELSREQQFTTSKSSADKATAAALLATENTNKAIADSTVQTNLAKELNEHQPKVVNRQWQVWDSTKKAYVNSGQPSYCPSPYISNLSTWMVWDEQKQQFVDSHVSVSTGITREQILSMVPDVVLASDEIATVSDDDAIRAALM